MGRASMKLAVFVYGVFPVTEHRIAFSEIVLGLPESLTLPAEARTIEGWFSCLAPSDTGFCCVSFEIHRSATAPVAEAVWHAWAAPRDDAPPFLRFRAGVREPYVVSRVFEYERVLCFE